MSAVRPHEDDRRVEKEKDKMEERITRVFGEGTGEVVERDRQGDVGEEAVRAKARKAEIAPSDREAEECNLDHAEG